MPELAVGQRRVANLSPLTDKQLRDAKRDLVYIFNVGSKSHGPIGVDGTLYTIPGRGKNETVSDPLVIDGVVYTTIYKGGEYQWVGRDGSEVAQEIVGTFRMLHPSQNLTPFGVFISTTPEPSQEEIDKATELWLEKCSEKVAEGDRLAQINNGVVDIGGGRTASNIGKDHRDAATELGLTRSWMGKSQRMVECPECSTANTPTASMCKGCDAVFDLERARKTYPQKFSDDKPRVGRPPNASREQAA